MLLYCCSLALNGVLFDESRKRMKLACQLSMSSSAQRFNPAGFAGANAHASQDRSSWRFTPRPRKGVPSAYWMCVPLTTSHAELEGAPSRVVPASKGGGVAPS